ncbi:hypothetical protein AA101099_1309 [Neoasaia chiangmaiensis NBRC 101099]|uniref:Uncharacterized protein n=1 Tax=Neoasaia chiangmaiensis TaxID=320497 RepID=A0A1U9KQK4_9PROT|nr:SCO family protein [Neoasaia chiangmaiensis]AQS88088.1 hypothetical protein A0U93_09180 [Neoasaia chiangmaiensis]GBR38711.1 hypothetical protein AA101099_1309 [Neoasaia chiangmaiensis NBRC 101099]GEN15774.1 hypothetical protein NCH01_22050 [Neoasaia chiangmaiensis]
MSGKKTWSARRVLLVAVVLAFALGWTGFRVASRYGMPLTTNGNEVGGSFRLTSLGEGSVTEGDFRGYWILMWFFDTHCPKDTCGPVLKTMSDAYVALGKDGIRVAPLVVTLDPVNDEAKQLQDYVLPLGHEDVPLTAAPNMIERVAKEFHAPIETIKAPDGTTYHRPAPRIVIMDPAGHYAGTVDADIGTDGLVSRLHELAHHG